MIELQPKFKWDMSNKDLNLFPVVHITTQVDKEFIYTETEYEDGGGSFLQGAWEDIRYDYRTDINISTKPWSWGGDREGSDARNYMPLLLNVPTIKESIDIESRKYKISNVKLKISNARYEAYKFSDRKREEREYAPGDTYGKPIGFMNQLVKIYWVNQTSAERGFASNE